jgi:hypothetical protein
MPPAPQESRGKFPWRHGVTAVVAVAVSWFLLYLIKPYFVTAPSPPTVTITTDPVAKTVTVTQDLSLTLNSQVDHCVCYYYDDVNSANNSQPGDPYAVAMRRISQTQYKVTYVDGLAGAAPHYAVVWVYWYNPAAPMLIFKFKSGPTSYTPPT